MIIALRVSYQKSAFAMQFTLLGSQAGIYYWKQKHKRSYELVSSTDLPVKLTICCLHYPEMVKCFHEGDTDLTD